MLLSAFMLIMTCMYVGPNSQDSRDPDSRHLESKCLVLKQPENNNRE